MKRKVDEDEISLLEQPHNQNRRQQLFFSFVVKKKLRSKLPRRRRRFVPVSPLLRTSSALSFECDSCTIVASSVNDRGVDIFGNNKGRNEKREIANVEVSESSCVESCSGAVSKKTVEEKVKRNEKLVKFNQNEVVWEWKSGGEAAEDSDIVNKSEISAEFSGNLSKKVSRTESSLELDSNDVVSLHSDLTYFQKKSSAEMEQKREEKERGSDAEHVKELVPTEFDFTCSEHFSNDGVSDEYDDYSSVYSELQSEIFPESSEFDFSDGTPSIWYDSGSQFSEKSSESPSPTFQLFRKFAQEFCKSDFVLEFNSKAPASFDENDDSHEITLPGLEDKEDQESFKMLRRRERRQVYLHDYAVEYCSTTDCGDLIIQQRLQMVHWIFEQSTNKELQRETMFLGVSLLDRFLSKGYFKTKRNLQIASIACLTLATRIEENQPFNSVRQKIFQIGSSAYSRCEVVAMEWLVQEVLKFQCYLPTLYNFLWFYLKATRATEKVEKSVKYLAVLALLGHEQLCYWPSTVAAGLVILASIAANQPEYCNSVTETHARIKDDDLPECTKSLAWLVNYIS